MISTHFTAIGVLLPLLVVQGHAAAAPAAATIDISTRARALQPGELVIVTLAMSQAATEVQVSAFGKTIPAFKVGTDAWQALVGIDVEQPPGSYALSAKAHFGSTILTGAKQIIVLRKRFATRTLRVPPEFVNPTLELQKRIETEAAFVQDVYAHSAPDMLWEAPFTRPVPQAANSSFGSRSVFNGEPGSPHAGVDFLSPAGTPIKAPNAGRIVAARELFYSGNTIIIDHGSGLFSTLAHLSKIDVREGESVVGGQLVGLVGATGRVTGPHLHWALRIDDARVDPLSALALLGSSRVTIEPRR